jgi:hypothetical protein
VTAEERLYHKIKFIPRDSAEAADRALTRIVENMDEEEFEVLSRYMHESEFKGEIIDMLLLYKLPDNDV